MEQSNADPSRGTLSERLSRAAALLRTDPAAAVDLAVRALSDAPADGHALMLFVSAQRARGDLAAARSFLESLAVAEPKLAAARYELGLVLGDMGEPSAAIDALTHLVELEPAHPEGWRALGDQLSVAGKPEAAGDAYARHFQLRVGTLQRLENAAGRKDDKLADAEGIFKDYLEVHPTAVATRRMLAEVYQNLNRPEDSAQQLLQALESSPGYASARWMLALNFIRRVDWERALVQLDLLIAQDPKNSRYLTMKANALVNSGDYPNAIACFEASLSMYPVGETWMLYGHGLATVGRIQEGVAAYRKAIALKPELAESYWMMSNLKTFRFEPSEMDAMRDGLAGTTLDDRNRRFMHFALGKALEDAKQYAPSFEQYREGNALFRKTLRYSAQATTSFVKRCKTLFTQEFFQQRAGGGCPAADPIFIVGLPRSGSTLIEQILASHSMVEGTSELSVLSSIATRISDHQRTHVDRYPEVLADLKPGELAAAGEEYLARTRIHRRTNRVYFIDKKPGNFQHLGLILLSLPNAKIIDVRRHPLGCGFAVYRQYFPQALPFAYDLAEIGRYYHDYVELMAHFDAVQPGRVYRVFYERMVADPEKEMRDLLAHCNLPFEEACLRFHETERGILTPSAEQVRQPLYNDALEQWRHYDAWLGPLKASLGAVLASYPAVPNFDARSPVFQAQWNMPSQPRWLNASPPPSADKG